MRFDYVRNRYTKLNCFCIGSVDFFLSRSIVEILLIFRFSTIWSFFAQQLATQFAADAQEISHLLREFNTSCSHVYQAQEGLANAYLRMSDISRQIGGKSLTVQPKNADFENICLQFSSFLEELSGMHRAEAEELRSALFLPSHKLPSQPGLQLVDNLTSTSDGEGGSPTTIQFADLPATERHREACEREVHVSLGRYMRLTRRCGPKEHDDAVLELSKRRRMFQKASVIYHARLNAAHFEREMVPLNAFFGFLITLRNHCKRIHDVVEQPSLGQFAEVIKAQFDCLQVQSTQSTEEFLNTLTNMQNYSLALFAPEPLFAKSDKSYLRTPDTDLLSKSGYLYMRVKKTFGFDWNEVYCFTQGGNLLYQQKGDLGAGVLVNLNGKGVFAEPVDIDDRRYTFQIVSAVEKREKKPQQEASSFLNSLFAVDTQPQTQTVVLQAENSTDRDERRRMFQKASVIYHARLNAAHFEREMVPLNAFFGFLITLRNHCKRIHDVVEQPSLGQFAEVIKAQFDCLQVQSTQSTEEFLNTLTNMQNYSLALFAPEPLFAKSDKSYLRTPDTDLLSKSGYLYMRVKKTFGFDWNEVYCFTQGGNLLYQQKGDLGAGVLVNLNGKGVFAEPVDIDDRRYTFQIVSAVEKREKKPQQEASSFLNSLFAVDTQPQTQTVVLQAENSTDRDEWIQTISNVIVNTTSFASKGLQPPEAKLKEPLPFVLVPRAQFPIEAAPRDSDEDFGEEEMESELDRALRISLASPSAWISQSPPLHFELIPVDASAPPPPSSIQAASDAGDGEGPSTAEKPANADVPLTFIGSMPLPRFHANPVAVGEFAKYLLTKRSEAKPSDQNCVARFTPDTLFLLESSPESHQQTVLSNFKLAQIVHCVEINVPDDKPVSQRKLVIVMTSEPHSAQWIDLTSGGLYICHFFETSNPAEFAERVLNLQLVRLAALNEEGESPEKARIMENIMRSSEWSSSSAAVRSPLRQAPEVTQVKPTAGVQPKVDEKDVAPIYDDDIERSPFDGEEVLVDLEPKEEDRGEKSSNPHEEASPST
nr:DCC interacting protein 13 beta [Hymenolepis microstoma]